MCIRDRSLGLTQTKVALAINVTFQQIQKYEKGTNGVSSNRLMLLSQFLKVPIIYFFEDYKEFKDINSSEHTNEDLNYSFLSRSDFDSKLLCINDYLWRPRPESNWDKRICNPLRNHSATWPNLKTK